MKRVNLREIAKATGFSIATVSLALRGSGMVSNKTSEHIGMVAKQMGYRPNPLLASLAGKRFRSSRANGGVPLAIFSFPMLPDGSGGRRSPYPRSLIAEAQKLGYSPKIYELTNESDPTAVFKELYFRMVQGIIITGSMDMKTFGKAFDWNHFSVVQCARFHTLHSFHAVRPNIFQAVKMAFMQLRSRNYRRIGFALGRHSQPMEDDEARHGAAIAMENTYLAAKDRLPIYDGNFGDQRAFIAWYDRYRPDAIVGFSVTQYWGLKDHGVNIPEQTGFVGMHLDSQDRSILCSGLYQNFEVISRQSVYFLDQMIRNHETGEAAEPYTLLIPSRWEEGKTVAKVDASEPAKSIGGRTRASASLC